MMQEVAETAKVIAETSKKASEISEISELSKTSDIKNPFDNVLESAVESYFERTGNAGTFKEGLSVSSKEMNEYKAKLLSSATEQNSQKLSEIREALFPPLTDAERLKIKEETGWSDEIVNAIGSKAEYEIYKNAGLIEAEIGGKKCLIRPDIDILSETNQKRIKAGRSPLDKDGNPIQLHHIGQHADSPLAELTFAEHRGNGNDVILHDKGKSTEVHGPGNNWSSDLKTHWKNRLEAEEHKV